MKTKGFTIIELLITITIIGVLATLTIVFLRPQILKARDAKRKSNINEIQTALEEYLTDNGCYPATGAVTCTPGNYLAPYLRKIQCDPEGGSYEYTSETTSCPSWYRIFAILENIKDPSVSPGIGPGGMYNYSAGSTNALPL